MPRRPRKCPPTPAPRTFGDSVREVLPLATPELREWLEALLAGESATWIGGVEVRAPAPPDHPPGVEPTCAEGRSAHGSPGRA